MIIQIGLNNWIVSIVKYVAVEIVYNDDTNEPLMMTLWAVNELHYETLMMTLKSNNDDANSNILLPAPDVLKCKWLHLVKWAPSHMRPTPSAVLSSSAQHQQQATLKQVKVALTSSHTFGISQDMAGNKHIARFYVIMGFCPWICVLLN